METIQLPVNELQRERLMRIDQEDFSGVRRKVREEMSERGIDASAEWLDEGILALKQYYAVALLDPLNKHAVSAVIDPFWHAHIMHTKEYVAFCAEVFEEFLHHEPLDRSDEPKLRFVHTLWKYTRGVYGRLFSYVHPDTYKQLADCTSETVCLHQMVSNRRLRACAVFEAVPACQ
ncbi:MAG: hypothetical protein HY421_02255 [Candidatus Kerfeldbacteria bacterium]|nr:hypothetical protein [Candidatus Kerfeldbacteria bacterium]